MISLHNPFISAALSYARLGWPVIPLHYPVGGGGCSCNNPACDSPAKHPIGKLVPHGLKDATTDEELIRQWWARYPQANIGIRTGAESGLVVLDIDPHNGGD